jgi:thioredoxin-like negative regulator of GroEL
MTTQYLVFSSSMCAPCRSLKQWLDDNGVSYSMHDASSSKAAQMRVRTVPTSVKLVDGAVDSIITGFQPVEAKRFFEV